MPIVESLSKLSKRSLLMLGLAMIMAIGVLDYLTGSELSFSIFYLLPIALVAWLVGRKSGLVLSFVGAVTWLIAEQLGGSVYSYPAIRYWNALVRLFFFPHCHFGLVGIAGISYSPGRTMAVHGSRFTITPSPT